MSQKVMIADLEAKIGASVALFIGMGSFETRCLTILNVLARKTSNFLFFKNRQAGESANESLQKMMEIAGEKAISIDLDLDKPTVSADAFQASLTHITNASEGIVFVDITTFTHEQLLIFLRVLSEAKIDRRFIFGYTGAEQYSVNTDPEDVWLSKGISQIRSVLGFPGEFLPSKKLHLIVLVGFEHERAKAVIEQFEPAFLTLGIAENTQSVSAAHYATNQKFFDEVKRFVDVRTSIYSSIDTFQFSGVDPILTREAVLAQTAKLPSCNTVVCPMNTKISTLGVGLAAIQDRGIQICYSRAIAYNESGYSTPSQQVTLFEMNFVKSVAG